MTKANKYGLTIMSWWIILNERKTYKKRNSEWISFITFISFSHSVPLGTYIIQGIIQGRRQIVKSSVAIPRVTTPHLRHLIPETRVLAYWKVLSLIRKKGDNNYLQRSFLYFFNCFPLWDTVSNNIHKHVTRHMIGWFQCS